VASVARGRRAYLVARVLEQAWRVGVPGDVGVGRGMWVVEVSWASRAQDPRARIPVGREQLPSMPRRTSVQAEVITVDNHNGSRYYTSMIRSFRDKDTQRVFNRERVRKLGSEVQRIAQRRLVILDAADALNDLRFPPGNRLEKLTGDRKGEYSIRINDQWRICFRWRSPDAYDVEIVDYH